VTLDDFLLVGGFVGTLASLLIALYSLREGGKWAAVATLVALVAASTGLSLYRSREHTHAIEQVEGEVVAILKDAPLTFDELHTNLLFRSFTDASEALFRTIQDGRVRHCLSRFQTEAGGIVSVRLYFSGRDPNDSGGGNSAVRCPERK
jgi:hypothetical protein